MVSKEISLSLGKNTCSSKYSLGEKWSPIVPYSIIFKNFYWSRVAFNPVLLSVCVCVCVCVSVCVCWVAQLCLTLCNPMECSPPGSSVHKIFQARKLEWVAILPSRKSSQPRDQTRVSCVDRCFFPLCHLGIPVLVSAVKQSESVICIHISTLFLILFTFESPQSNQ